MLQGGKITTNLSQASEPDVFYGLEFGDNSRRINAHGRLAQLAEHRFYTPGVTGSSPVPPTNKINGLGELPDKENHILTAM